MCVCDVRRIVQFLLGICGWNEHLQLGCLKPCDSAIHQPTGAGICPPMGVLVDSGTRGGNGVLLVFL